MDFTQFKKILGFVAGARLGAPAVIIMMLALIIIPSLKIRETER
jgi:hypothetical protein